MQSFRSKSLKSSSEYRLIAIFFTKKKIFGLFHVFIVTFFQLISIVNINWLFIFVNWLPVNGVWWFIHGRVCSRCFRSLPRAWICINVFTWLPNRWIMHQTPWFTGRIIVRLNKFGFSVILGSSAWIFHRVACVYICIDTLSTTICGFHCFKGRFNGFDVQKKNVMHDQCRNSEIALIMNDHEIIWAISTLFFV